VATPREQVFPAQPALIGGGRIIPTPAQFFLTGEDRLRVVTANSVTGVRVAISARIANLRGDTIAERWDHVPNTNRTTKTEDFELGVGSLLNVTAFATAGAPLSGQTYVMVQLVRGIGAAAIVLGTLLAGYVTTTQAIGWPGSPIVSSTEGEPAIRLIFGSVPAVGAEFLETCPTGARWQLISICEFFQTSAAVGNRNCRLLLQQSLVNYGLYPIVAAMVASQSTLITWATGASDLNPFANSVFTAALPTPLFLQAGQTFGSSTVGMQAGDQWGTPAYAVREWLEVG